MEKDGPLDGRKYNKSNNDSQMGQKKYGKDYTYHLGIQSNIRLFQLALFL